MNTKKVSQHRRRSYHWGIIAELLCILFLIIKGYSILAKRYRNHCGEIDIIASRGKVVAFIEVKARAEKEVALASISITKQQRLVQTASGFIVSRQKKYVRHDLRFDVMVVTSPFRIYHLTNAWGA